MKKSIVFVVLVFLMLGCATTGENNKEKNLKSAEDNTQGIPVSPIKQDDTATVLVNTVIEHIHKLPNKRLTVTDFTAIDGGESEIGKLIAEKITTKLSQVDEIKVIERKQLKKILEEQKLSLSDITAEDEKEVGQILNVDAIISGSVAHLDDYIEINARMIDVTTGEIYCAINKREKFDLKKKDLARLPQTQQVLISQEFKKRETERKQNPELFSLKETMRKQLLEIKRQNSGEYDHVVRTIRRMERIKKENHRLFLLVTEPQNSPKLKKVKHQNPELSKKVSQMRKQLGFTINQVPAYREMLWRERHKMIRQIKVGRKQVQ
jgi:TolB-like protein